MDAPAATTLTTTRDTRPLGLACPKCGGRELTVSATRSPAPGMKIRHRTCTGCGTRLKSREVLITTAIVELNT